MESADLGSVRKSDAFGGPDAATGAVLGDDGPADPQDLSQYVIDANRLALSSNEELPIDLKINASSGEFVGKRVAHDSM